MDVDDLVRQFEADGEPFSMSPNFGPRGGLSSETLKGVLRYALYPAALESVLLDPAEGLEDLTRRDLMDERALATPKQPKASIPDEGDLDEQGRHEFGLGTLERKDDPGVFADEVADELSEIPGARRHLLVKVDAIVEDLLASGRLESKRHRSDLHRSRRDFRRLVETAYPNSRSSDHTLCRIHAGCVKAMGILVDATGQASSVPRDVGVVAKILAGKVQELAGLVDPGREPSNEKRRKRVDQALLRWTKKTGA